MNKRKLFSFLVAFSLLAVTVKIAGNGVEALAGPPPKGSTPYAPDAIIGSITAGNGVEALAGSPPEGSTPYAPDAIIGSITGLASSFLTGAADEVTSQVACDSYYFRPDTVNVGAGSAGGIRKIATTGLPTGSTVVESKTLIGSFTEIARFYSHPPLSSSFDFTGPVNGSFWVNISGSANVEFRVQMSAYDPVSGNISLLGVTSPGAFLPSETDTEVTFTLPQPATSVPAGHRFLLILEAMKSGGGPSPTVDLLYNSSTRASQFTVCRPAPPILSISKTGPAAAIAGDFMSYRIIINNEGGTTATNLIISDTIPPGAFYVSGSGGVQINNIIQWQHNSLAPGSTLQLPFLLTATQTITNSNYQVTADNNVSAVGKEVVATIISPPGEPNLTITKTGPAAAGPGQLIAYTLVVTNSGDAKANNLLVEDTLPTGANYISGGTRVGNTIRWTAGSLDAGSSLQFSFSVTATQTITNQNYRVLAQNAPEFSGQKPVVVQIAPSAPPIQEVFLPLMIKPGGFTTLIIKSENTGGINPVQVLHPTTNSELLRCTVANNTQKVCGQFPAIGTYKIVAVTANCGTLRGTFSDATPGATVTRRIFCN